MATPPSDVIDLSSPPSSPSANDRLRTELEYLQRANGTPGILPNMLNAVTTMGTVSPLVQLAQRQALLQLQARANSGLVGLETQDHAGNQSSVTNPARSHRLNGNFPHRANQHIHELNTNEQLQQQSLASAIEDVIRQAAQDAATGVSPSAYALHSGHLGYQDAMLANHLSYAGTLGANRIPTPPENVFPYDSSNVTNIHELAAFYSRRRRSSQDNIAEDPGATADRSPEVIDLLDDDDDDENEEKLREQEARTRTKKASKQSRKRTFQAAGISTDERPVRQSLEDRKEQDIEEKEFSNAQHAASTRPTPNSVSLRSNQTPPRREKTTRQQRSAGQELRNDHANKMNVSTRVPNAPAAEHNAQNNQHNPHSTQPEANKPPIQSLHLSADVQAEQKISQSEQRQGEIGTTATVQATVPATVVLRSEENDKVAKPEERSANQDSQTVGTAFSGASKPASGAPNGKTGSVSNVHTTVGAVSQGPSLQGPPPPYDQRKDQNSNSFIAEINAKIKESKQQQAKHPSEHESIRQWVDRLETAISLLDKAIEMLQSKDEESFRIMTTGENENIVFKSPDEMCALQIQMHTQHLAKLLAVESIKHNSKLSTFEVDLATLGEAQRWHKEKQRYGMWLQKVRERCSSLRKDAVTREQQIDKSSVEECMMKMGKIKEKAKKAQKKIDAAEHEMSMMSDTFLEGYKDSLRRSFQKEVEFQERQIDELERRLDRLERRNNLTKMWQRRKKKAGDRRSQSRKIHPSDMSAMNMIDVLSNDLYQLEKNADKLRAG